MMNFNFKFGVVVLHINLISFLSHTSHIGHTHRVKGAETRCFGLGKDNNTMESSSASSFRGDDHQQQLHGGEFRLLSLVGKLGHSLSEIRLRALRNLRCKVTSEHLAPPERFFEEQEELYVNLKSMLITPPSTPTDEANHGLMQMEVLLFIAEACKKLGSGFRRR